MNIALIAHDRKKELMVQFCMAYCGILAKHNICATGTTGKFVEEVTGLKSTSALRVAAGRRGKQTAAAAYKFRLILVLFFRDPMSNAQYEPDVHAISACVTCTISRLQPARQPLKSLSPRSGPR